MCVCCDAVAADKEEQQCRQLMAGLDKVVSDLDKQEKAIYARVRPPLEQNRPLQDSADRLQDMKVRAQPGSVSTCHVSIPGFNEAVCVQDVSAAVRRIEPEKSSKVAEAKSFLTSNQNCPSAPQLNSKVDEANKKYTKIEQLLQCSQDKYGTFCLLLAPICTRPYCSWILNSFQSALRCLSVVKRSCL